MFSILQSLILWVLIVLLYYSYSCRILTSIAAGGFFGPQGRKLRIPLEDPEQNDKIFTFEHEGHRITNFEMESSALAGMAALMGHRATTICTIIAQRIAKDACTDYKPFVKDMIRMALDKLATL